MRRKNNFHSINTENDIGLNELGKKLVDNSKFVDDTYIRSLDLHKEFILVYNTADMITIKGILENKEYRYKQIFFTIRTDWLHLLNNIDNFSITDIILKDKPYKKFIFDNELNNIQENKYILDNYTTVEWNFVPWCVKGEIGDKGEPGESGVSLELSIDQDKIKDLIEKNVKDIIRFNGLMEYGA